MRMAMRTAVIVAMCSVLVRVLISLMRMIVPMRAVLMVVLSVGILLMGMIVPMRSDHRLSRIAPVSSLSKRSGFSDHTVPFIGSLKTHFKKE